MDFLSFNFIMSQILVLFAMGSDFLSMQFRRRNITFIFLMVSATLISIHYFLLGKVVAGIILGMSIFRYAVCCFTSSKKYLYFFLILNTLALIFTYNEFFDLIVYVGTIMLILGSFQKYNKKMRQFIMLGVLTLLLYNVVIFSPIGVLVEGSFLISCILGYYRYYVTK